VTAIHADPRADRIDQIRRLADTRLSATEIALAVGGGMTKGSIIGLCRRNSIPLAGSRGPLGLRSERRAVETKAKPPVAPKAVPRPAEPHVRVQPEPDILVWLIDADLSPAASAIATLQREQCRFPVGDVQSPDFRFCDAVAISGGPYCESCAAIAFNPGLPRSIKWRPARV